MIKYLIKAIELLEAFCYDIPEVIEFIEKVKQEIFNEI